MDTIKDNFQAEFEQLYQKIRSRAAWDDLKSLEINYKMSWYEHIPLVGAMFYIRRINIIIIGIKAGKLKQKIYVYLFRYRLYTLNRIIGIIWVLIFPQIYFYILKLAIKTTKEEFGIGNFD